MKLSLQNFRQIQSFSKYKIGIFHLVDGSVYQGEIENDSFHGDGSFLKSYLFSRLDYSRNELKNGHGTIRWSDGGIYNGQYLDDIKHEYGETQFADGRICKGQWKKWLLR